MKCLLTASLNCRRMGLLIVFGRKSEWKIGRWGNWETEVMKLEVRICLRKERGGSAASAQRLTPGLVRKAPRASLNEEFWMVSSNLRVDLLAVL